jgi:hypothetical protein
VASAVRLTLERKAVAAALLFLAAAFVAGVNPGSAGLSYHTFGVSEGIVALLLTHVFLQRGIWWSPAGAVRWVAVAYGAAANAQILELLIPPPGILEWLVLTGIAFSSWAVVGAGSRSRLIAGLAAMSLLLAVLKFSVIPVLWDRAGPGPGEAWGLGDLAEGLRRLVVDYEPITRGGQLLGVVALALWAAATRMLWRHQVSRAKNALR